MVLFSVRVLLWFSGFVWAFVHLCLRCVVGVYVFNALVRVLATDVYLLVLFVVVFMVFIVH